VVAIGDCPLADLRRLDLEGWVLDMKDRGNQPSTINAHIRIVRAWLNWCSQQRLAVKAVPRDLPTVSQSTKSRRVADVESLHTMLGVVDVDTFDGHRFHVMVLLMLDTGARCSEVCGIDLGDVASDLGTVRVMGKGSRERLLYLSPRMALALGEWLHRRERSLRTSGVDTPVLFPTLTGRRLTHRLVGKRFRKESARAGLPSPLNAHGLRHLWATHHAKSGTNVLLLRQLGGWSSMSMVMHYVSEVDGAAASEAASRASLVGTLVGGRVRRRSRPSPGHH
jgi:site-specific recombinase XerD